VGIIVALLLGLLLTLWDLEDCKRVGDIMNVVLVLGVDPDVVVACVQMLCQYVHAVPALAPLVKLIQVRFRLG